MKKSLKLFKQNIVNLYYFIIIIIIMNHLILIKKDNNTIIQIMLKNKFLIYYKIIKTIKMIKINLNKFMIFLIMKIKKMTHKEQII